MRPRLPYWVAVYRHIECRAELVYAQWCPDESLARHFAMNTLLDCYLLLIHPHRDDDQRLFWCELVPGRRVGGRWEPGLTDGEVDAAYLDGHSGEISWDLAASARRWALARRAPEPS
jgi:hypothetical protein